VQHAAVQCARRWPQCSAVLSCCTVRAVLPLCRDDHNRLSFARAPVAWLSLHGYPCTDYLRAAICARPSVHGFMCTALRALSSHDYCTALSFLANASFVCAAHHNRVLRLGHVLEAADVHGHRGGDARLRERSRRGVARGKGSDGGEHAWCERMKRLAKEIECRGAKRLSLTPGLLAE